MAANFPVAYLRRYALPAHYLADLDNACRGFMPALHKPTPARPRLVAAWHINAAGRPVCRWTIECGFPPPPAFSQTDGSSLSPSNALGSAGH